jgi:PAS domain S-box-containing protein
MSKEKDHTSKIRSQYTIWLSLVQSITVIFAVLVFMLLKTFSAFETELDIVITAFLTVIFTGLSSYIASKPLAQPLEKIHDKLFKLQTIDPETHSKDKTAKSKLLMRSVYSVIDDLVEKNNSRRATAQKAKDHLEALIDQLSVGVIALDSDRNINTYNHAAQIIFGTKGDDALGNQLADIAELKINDHDFLEEWLDEAEATTIGVDEKWIDVELTDKKGRKRNLEIVAHYNSSNTTGLETVLIIIDRTGEQQNDDRKVDFVAIAAHELRSPITVIRGYLEIIQDEIKDKLDDEQKSFIKKMDISVEQLAMFIGNVLQISKIDHGEVIVNHADTDLNGVISDTATVLQEIAKANNRKLKLDLLHTLPHAAGDSNLLPIVINNLVGNSIKFTGEGGHITVKTSYNESEDTIETHIIDDGIGMPASMIKNLFTKFYRSHRSKRKFGGTGIGLFLSKSIVEAHGGRIWVKSTEGEGSTFAFSLPTWASFAKQESEPSNNKGIIKTDHGWIKNNSMYRR